MGGSFSRALSEFSPSIFSRLSSSTRLHDEFVPTAAPSARLPHEDHIAPLLRSAQVSSPRAALHKGDANAASARQRSEHAQLQRKFERRQDGADERCCLLSSTPAEDPTKHLLAPCWRRSQGRGWAGRGGACRWSRSVKSNMSGDGGCFLFRL